MNISGRKTNWQQNSSATDAVDTDRYFQPTVIQLRRFRLLFVDADFCASEIDVRLNSCHKSVDIILRAGMNY